ncbi:MAG TPA: aminotransferase class I/II-fold pyridoxal phosphate-dependent enzyme [Myxococcales bacterium]|nr:aminotransferase class I/II-fold pyridoxal phosphate-dependent enzyme [Myxococcales bacterium]
MARRVSGFGTSVFSEFSALAIKHQAVNLGQGFPDFDGPEEIKEAAIQAIRDGVNQYAVSMGAPALRQAIAAHAERFHGMRVDPDTMVGVTSGATEAIFDTILGTVDPGDEVILFEPFYDSYVASVEMAGGVPRYVRLQPPGPGQPAWWFDRAELEAAFSDRTRLVLVNTPHNPTGKVFTREELELIGELCARRGALVLADEVYEHIVYPPARHLRAATLPGLADRTITVSSAGKSFSFTGWKVGWVIAPPPLRQAVQAAHQFVTFATASPFQAAAAAALRLPDAYFAALAETYRKKRDRLVKALNGCGLNAWLPEGSYFAMADIRPFGFADDFEFCRHLTREVGVAAIPPSAFYGEAHRAQGRVMARFAFCKTDAVLAAAEQRLAALRPRATS